MGARSKADVLIVGGGVIGLSLAYELTGRGVGVTVLDRGALGREASWAGAGILNPGPAVTAGAPVFPQVSPLDWLRGLSDPMLETWSRELREQTGIDNGYRRCGCLHVALDERQTAELDEEAEGWRRSGLAVEALAVEAPYGGGAARVVEARALEIEPELGKNVRSAVRLPRGAQLRSPRHVRALATAVTARGGRLRPETPVLGLATERGGGRSRVNGVRTADGVVEAGRVVVAAGPWTGALLEPIGVRLPTPPVKGQIVLLETPSPVLNHVVWNGLRYVVPRDDGRVLVGSTMERVGFDRSPSAAGVSELLDFAARLVPALARASFLRAWAGLRPGSPDGLPSLGSVPGWDGLHVATGHFRGGFELSAGTARVLADALTGDSPSAPPAVLAAFDPGRHAESAAPDPHPLPDFPSAAGTARRADSDGG